MESYNAVFSVYLRQYAGWQSRKAAAEGRHNWASNTRCTQHRNL